MSRLLEFNGDIDADSAYMNEVDIVPASLFLLSQSCNDAKCHFWVDGARVVNHNADYETVSF